MGIKFFFPWLKNNFPSIISQLSHGDTFKTLPSSPHIDNCIIDMNGVFHASAQKVYEYGNFKSLSPLLSKRKHDKNRKLLLFQDICKTIEIILQVTSPTKRLILCVDGPAPVSKQCQQRQRRFVSALNRTDNSFDTSSITPGTEFMDELGKYIDWFIQMKMSTESTWQGLEVIFSSDKSAGEGEHKGMRFVRFYGTDEESYCIHGLDADLIMLALSTHKKKFYILRDDMYNARNAFLVLNIGLFRTQLLERLIWKGDFKKTQAINDFIFICFMIGNDFIPHIPSLEILENGIDLMIEIYKNTSPVHGHITHTLNSEIIFSKPALKYFLQEVSNFEKTMFERKIHKGGFFKDLLLEQFTTYTGSECEVDIEKYKEAYYKFHHPLSSVEEVCHRYFEGLQWIISYYTQGVPCWKWKFPFYYGPFASDLSTHIDSFQFLKYKKTFPVTPYEQLMAVLPPKSANLIPSPLREFLSSDDSPLHQFNPSTFEIDLSGKRREWEGIALLPMSDYKIIKEIYESNKNKLSKKDAARNKLKKSTIYFFDDSCKTIINSPYGKFRSKSRIWYINL